MLRATRTGRPEGWIPPGTRRYVCRRNPASIAALPSIYRQISFTSAPGHPGNGVLVHIPDSRAPVHDSRPTGNLFHSPRRRGGTTPTVGEGGQAREKKPAPLDQGNVSIGILGPCASLPICPIGLPPFSPRFGAPPGTLGENPRLGHQGFFGGTNENILPLSRIGPGPRAGGQRWFP